MSWVIVGLGNPGAEYVGTRHNTGREAVESYAKKYADGDWREDKKASALTVSAHEGKESTRLVLPDTFMNKSGSAVARYVKSVKAAERLIVVYDDLDLPLGSVKLSFDRGSGGHKGLESIMRALKTKKFTRIRIGVSPTTASGKTKKPHGDEEVNRFILATFRPSEKDEMKKASKKAAEAIASIITEGREIAMNRFNS